MSTLRLAGNSVLGELGTHLQIVLDTGSAEYEIEVQRADFWNVEGHDGDVDHTQSAHYREEGSYAITTLDIGTRDSNNVWELLKQAAFDFEAMHFPYYNGLFQSQNSNTFAYSMLLAVGIDAEQYYGAVQTGGAITGDWDIRDQVTFTISGTAGADWFYSGAMNDLLAGSTGDDILSAGGGADKIVGGADRDELDGGEGADVILIGELGGSGAFGVYASAEKVDAGTGTDYVAISAGSGDRVELQGGDAGDRLIVYKEMLGGPLSTDGKHAAFALTGGVFGVVSYGNSWDDNAGLHDPDANVLTDNETGESYRQYFYVDAPFSRESGVDIVSEAGLTFEYRHYVAAHRLEILITRPGATEEDPATLLSTTVINDYQPGDYGINLKLFFLADLIFDDISATEDYHLLSDGIAAFQKAIEKLKADSSVYGIEVDPNADADNALSTLKVTLNGDDTANSLTGNDVQEKFLGLDGNDRIVGNGGDDDISGGTGNDNIAGGSGADLIKGGAGTDTADYGTSLTSVIVNLLSGLGTGGDAEGDLLSGIEYLIGSTQSDQLFGDDAINRLTGGLGNDVLSGAGGNDILIGGEGADTFMGGAGDRDVADYRDALQAIGINLALGGFLGEASGDTFSGIEYVYGSEFADQIIGDALINRLVGGLGGDMLNAGGGNDYLLGGLGEDTLTGGLGQDVFLFEEGAFGIDMISDFAAGIGRTDRISLAQQGVANFNELTSHFIQTATGVDIQLVNGLIKLAGLNASQLVADDFIFS